MLVSYIFTSIAVAWNIVSGYGKELSLGHAVFFGIGAYVPMILFLHYGVPVLVGLAVAVVISVALGVFIAALTLRLHGAFFAMSTIAVVEVAQLLTLYDSKLTGGGNGLVLSTTTDPLNLFFVSSVPYYYISFGFMIAALLVTLAMERSRISYYLKATGDDEVAAESIGVNTFRYKVVALMISSALATIPGAYYATYQLILLPQGVFSYQLSIEIAAFGIVGGAGQLFGPVVGGLVLYPVQSVLATYLGSYAGLSLILYGALIVLSIKFLSGGIVGAIRRRFHG